VSVIKRLISPKPVAERAINYAQMLEHMQNKRVVRLLIYDDGKEAIVEVCIPGYEDEPLETMERQIFSCLLPGDYHETTLKLAKEANSKNAGPDKGTVVCKMDYVDPSKVAPPIVGQTIVQVVPIVAFWIFQQSLEFVEYVKRGMEPKKSARRKLAEAYGASVAQEFSKDSKSTTGVRFTDVAGVDHAVDMFKEIIQLMVGDERYSKIGATLPKGVLLEGPPGTGKTLLAKAVACEAGVPFFSANGSEFVEMFVGVAAARVRDLFRRARRVTPAIVFIDEIDTIGRARGKSHGADNDEREQGLLQLLVEMDGFDTKETQVLVIGATNLRSQLDPALLRAGRFDRIVRLGLPDEANRMKILEVHAVDKQISRQGDLEFDTNALLRRTAQLTVGYSGAELANLLNEAAIIAVRREKPEIGMPELELAMEKMKLGLPRPPLTRSEEKRKLAYIEAGRAVLITRLAPALPDVLQVSVTPRGEKPSRVVTVPKDREASARTNNVKSYDEYLSVLAASVAGRATEEVVFGRMGVTLATAQELSNATNTASILVMQSGTHPQFEYTVMEDQDLIRQPDLQQKVDAAIQEATSDAFSRACRMVRQNRPAIDAVVEELLEKDTVYGTRIREIVAASLMVEVAESTLSSGMAAKAPALTSGEVAYVGEGKLGAVCFSRLLARGDGHAGVVAFAHSRGARSSPTAGACTFRTGSVRVAGTAVAQLASASARTEAGRVVDGSDANKRAAATNGNGTSKVKKGVGKEDGGSGKERQLAA